jgi:hypothetical protein
VASAREPYGARALACALLIAEAPDPEGFLSLLGRDPGLRAEVGRLAAVLGGVPRRERLAVLDLALPALDHLSPAQASALAQDLATLAGADGRTTAFEWAAQRMVRRRLAPLMGGRAEAPVRFHDLGEVQVECLELLSALAWAGQREPASAQRALEVGVAALGSEARWSLLPDGRVDAARLDAALARLDEAAPELKGRVVAACAACALADARVLQPEVDLVRAVASSLGCPVPPLQA